MLELSKDQKVVLQQIKNWFNDFFNKKIPSKEKKQFLTLGGYAGTGKTTLISFISKLVHEKEKFFPIAFVSYTGKAARVLKNSLKKQKSLLRSDFVGTIHSLIYEPIINSKQVIVGWEKRDFMNYMLIIVDEASMVDQEIWKDLLSYHVPILAVGDHGQLPPIKGDFNLMQNPEIKLENIHRQAKKNPIIQLSTIARRDGVLPKNKFSGKVKVLTKGTKPTQDLIHKIIKDFDSQTLFLCGLNKTRVALNKYIRKRLGFSSLEPQKKDKVICLRNNSLKRIYNGMLGTILDIKDQTKLWYKVRIKFDEEDDIYEGFIFKEQFNSLKALNYYTKRSLLMKGDLFDFGYALTVHKAQGSQADKVVLMQERLSFMSEKEWKRWLYTGVTRAVNELYVITTPGNGN